MFNWTEAPGQTQNTLEDLNLRLWEHFQQTA